MTKQPENGLDPLSIISDPNNIISKEKMLSLDDEEKNSSTPNQNEDPQQKKNFSRRDLLRFGGIAAAAATVAASGAAGFATGRSDDAYTGYGRTYQGGDMFFNREPFRADVPAMMEPVGPVERPDWYDFLFERTKAVVELIKKKEWTPDMGLEKMPGSIGDYYRSHPERYTAMLDQFERNTKRLDYWNKEAHKQYAIAGAYTMAYANCMYNSNGSAVPEDPHDYYLKTGIPQPPEVWDYRGVSPHKMEFKSPAHASKLIKRMAHQFGMSIVGIAKFDPRFMFKNLMRGMPNKGHDSWGDKVPSHWKSIIVFGVPMNWDGTYGAIPYSTSFDAYFRSRCGAGLMENFLKALGHPARSEFPGSHYEIMMTPYVLLAGLGEYSRSGMAMIPELGCNFRPAAVITDIEFEYDKPINVKMAEFCKKCKICAETCPSGAIPSDDEPQTVVRGFKRWLLDEEKCYTQWVSGPTVDGLGCRICVGVCPYTRKNTWIHTISRELEPRDPFGVVSTGLLAMQQNFFKYPAGEEFRAKWDGGKEAVYHNPPWWMRAEDFFSNVEKNWEYHGLE